MYICCMELKFKHLVNEMIEKGWRVYYFSTFPPSGILDNMCHARNLEMLTYEGKPFLFVRDKYKKEVKNEKK